MAEHRLRAAGRSRSATQPAEVSPSETVTPTDPFAPCRLVGTAFALVTLFIVAAEVWRNIVAPECRDFLSFWAAARLAIAGTPALVYDSTALHDMQRAVVAFGSRTQLPFPYPPAFLLILIPFALLPYGPAMAIWLFASGAFFLFSFNRLVPKARLLALGFPAVLVNCAVGQNGFLTAGLFCAAMALLPRRPSLAGILIGCFVLKPQLGLAIPVALLASRQWRAIAGAAVASVLVLLAGIVAFGWQATAAWIAQLPLYESIARDGVVGWIQLASPYASARQAGLGMSASLSLHCVIAIIAGIAVWHVWRRESDHLTRAATLACATVLASPYIFLYDQIILVLPFAWLARKNVRAEYLAVLWSLPIITIAQHYWGPGPVNLNPLPPLLLLISILLHRMPSDAGPSSNAARFLKRCFLMARTPAPSALGQRGIS